MKKSILLVATVVALCSFVMTIKLVKVKAGKIQMQVPETFEALDEQARINEYAGKNTPIAVYRSPRDKSALTIYQVSDSSMIQQAQEQRKRGYNMSFQKDLKMEAAFKKSSIMSKFQEVTFIDEGIKTINGKEVIVFEFEGIMEGKDKRGGSTLSQVYNYMVHGYDKHHSVSVGFICDKRVKDEYTETVHKMMNSIKIK